MSCKCEELENGMDFLQRFSDLRGQLRVMEKNFLRGSARLSKRIDAAIDAVEESRQCNCTQIHDGPCQSPYAPKPAPVVERFVVWEYDDAKSWAEPMCGGEKKLVPNGDYTRRKRGEVVAKRERKQRSEYWSHPITQYDVVWYVKFPDDDIERCVGDSLYQTLKRNGCFGEEVE